MKIGNINIEKGVLLAPMESVTDLAYRVISRRMGADIVYTEFIASEAIIRDSKRSFEKMKIEDEEHPVSVQIFGGVAESMAESAKYVEESGADFLDINFGCWVKKVVSHCAGAALLKDLSKLGEIIKATKAATKLPVTIKTRIGWDKTNINILEAAKIAEDNGAEAITVHCRTREMGMTGLADWSWIEKVKNTENIPVILNGDVVSPESAKKAFDETGCDAVMIGRAAIGNPFIFREIKHYLATGEILAPPTYEERINVALVHLELTMTYKDPKRAINETRKHYSGYLKGLFGASNIRQTLVTLNTYEEIKEVCAEYIDFLKNRENEGLKILN
jgi:tRNA-dihydrouridine synthase B